MPFRALVFRVAVVQFRGADLQQLGTRPSPHVRRLFERTRPRCVRLR